jgi:Holliday junction resolvase
MTNLYRKGRIAEGKIAERLRNKGYYVRQSGGSRGPADLVATKGQTKLYVQVKSGSASLDSTGRRRLRSLARRRGGTAMLMHYDEGKIKSRFV